LDDLGRAFEAVERVLAHFWSLSSRKRRIKAGSFDTAIKFDHHLASSLNASMRKPPDP
jgi:hypothetical protein